MRSLEFIYHGSQLTNMLYHEPNVMENFVCNLLRAALLFPRGAFKVVGGHTKRRSDSPGPPY